jgi:hypothetical protein
LQGLVRHRLQEQDLISEEENIEQSRLHLKDRRIIIFADEPDIALYENDQIIAAVEIKGGIDKAGVLERVGAAIKSLSRAKEENPASVTILILQEVSMTPQSIIDLQTNKAAVNYWFTLEDILEDEDKQNELFQLLGI